MLRSRSSNPALRRDEPVVLGGLCMGGVLAAAAALESRRRIAGLC